MKKPVIAAIVTGLCTMATTGSSRASILLECKITSGQELLQPGFQQNFCAQLRQYLMNTKELEKAKSGQSIHLNVELAVLSPNLADVIVKLQNAPELKLSINSRDSDLRPSTAQTLVLPIVRLVKGR